MGLEVSAAAAPPACATSACCKVKVGGQPPAGWAAVVAATTGHFGKLDVLVNNAGISGSAEQDFYSTEAWHRIMTVNATGCSLASSTRSRP